VDDAVRALRSALVDALAGEHSLRRRALREQQEVDRWLQRAAYAGERQLDDLAASARARAGRHNGMAQLLRQQAEALHAEVERLRAGGEAGHAGGRAPPPRPSLESQFAALEIEEQLDQLRRERRGTTVAHETTEPA
jgi:hypothetical protein